MERIPAELYETADTIPSMGGRKVAKPSVRVCFLIQRLSCGGRERQVAEFARRLDPARFDVTVLTFYPGGLFWHVLDAAPDVRLQAIGKRGRWDLVGFGARMLRLLREIRPDVVHGFLDVGNLCAWFGGRAVGAKVVWGIAGEGVSALDPAHRRAAERINLTAVRVERVLARHVDLVISNSHGGLRAHRAAGVDFPEQRAVVIPNGIDTERFRLRPESRRLTRSAWGIQDTDRVVGLIGRRHPMKDHATFLSACARLAATDPRIRVICVGDGDRATGVNGDAARALGSRLRWEPARADIEHVYPALDLLVLSSASGEGLPNVVAEAMACEVPCVATDVADTARLLDDPLRIVPARDPARLADACSRVLALPDADRRRFGARDRERIEKMFNVDLLVERTSAALERVAAS